MTVAVPLPIDLGIILYAIRECAPQWIVYVGEFEGQRCAVFEFMPAIFAAELPKPEDLALSAATLLPAPGIFRRLADEKRARYIKTVASLPPLPVISEAMSGALDQVAHCLGGGYSDITESYWLAYDHSALDTPPLTHQMTFAEVRNLGTGIGRAMVRLHERKIYHLDIHPSTVRFSAETGALLTGFGVDVRKLAARGAEQQLLARRDFAPPELFDRTAVSPIGPWTDIYLASATLYTLLTGHPPIDFRDRSDDPAIGLAHMAGLLQRRVGELRAPSMIGAIIAGLNLCIADRPQDSSQWLERLEADHVLSPDDGDGICDAELSVPHRHSYVLQRREPLVAPLVLGGALGGGMAVALLKVAGSWPAQVTGLFAVAAICAAAVLMQPNRSRRRLVTGVTLGLAAGFVFLTVANVAPSGKPKTLTDWIIGSGALAVLLLASRRAVAWIVLPPAALLSAACAFLYPGWLAPSAAPEILPQPSVEMKNVPLPTQSDMSNVVNFVDSGAVDTTMLLGRFRLKVDRNCDRPLRIKALRTNGKLSGLSIRRPSGILWTTGWIDKDSRVTTKATQMRALNAAPIVKVDVRVDAVRRADGSVADGVGLVGRVVALSFDRNSSSLSLDMRYGPGSDDVEREAFIRCKVRA